MASSNSRNSTQGNNGVESRRYYQDSQRTRSSIEGSRYSTRGVAAGPTRRTARPTVAQSSGRPSVSSRSSASYSRDAYLGRTSQKRKSRSKVPYIIACAAVLVLAVGVGVFFNTHEQTQPAEIDTTVQDTEISDVSSSSEGYNWAAQQPKTAKVVQQITEDAPLTFNYDISEFNFYNGPLHLYRTGQPGGTFQEIETATGNPVGSPFTQNAEPGSFGSYYVKLEDSGRKVVAFTFDDGPSPEWTPALLDVLAQNDAKATFFMLGSQAERYPDVARQVADAGHQVASHTYDHSPDRFLNVCDTDGARRQLQDAHNAIYEATGQRPWVVRPPGGNMDWDNVIACEGYATAFVGWSIGTGDFERPGVDYICNAVTEPLFSGGIVLMHDGGGDRSQTVEAVARLVPLLKEQGYEFVTVDEIIKMEEEKIVAAGEE